MDHFIGGFENGIDGEVDVFDGGGPGTTLIRMAVLPCQVVPPHQQVPSA
jgi:hypothetical protein